MHGNNKDWISRKKEMARKQEEFNERQRLSNKKLKRSRINDQRKLVVDYDVWPAEPHVLQRICNFLETTTITQLIRKLENGEKVTTKHGAVYSLVPLNGNH